MKDEWTDSYSIIMPMLGLAVAVAGLSLSLLTLQRLSAQGVSGRQPGYTPLDVDIPRVHYQDSEVFVEVRNPGEWHELREFVQPNNPYLGAIYG